MIQPWLFRCALQPGESLASFTCRSAAANAIEPRIFLRHLNTLQGVKDLDLASPLQIDAMENAMSLASGELSDAGIAGLVGKNLALVEQGRRTPWLVPISHPAVCLHCLNQDCRYLRRDWRLTYRAWCFTHEMPLQDKCSRCNERISLVGRVGEPDRFLPQCRCFRKKPVVAPILKEACGAWQYFERLLQATDCESPWRNFGCEFGYQFLAGVRALTTFLAAPKAASQLRILLERRMGLPPGAIHSGSTGQNAFELLSCQPRQVSLDAVAILLADWPTEFVQVMRRAGVRASHFLQVDQRLPYWLKTAITEGLSAVRYQLSTSEVLAAKRAVEFRGEHASRLGLARLLGTRDGRAIDAFFSKKRRRHSPEEAIAFFRDAIQALQGIPSARAEREVARRNIAILLLSAATGARVEDLCTMPARAMPTMPSTIPSDLALFLRTVTKALRTRRPDHEPLFVSRFGTAMAGAAVRLASSRFLNELGAPGVWRSADALRGVFVQDRDVKTGETAGQSRPPPLGRRRDASSVARP